MATAQPPLAGSARSTIFFALLALLLVWFGGCDSDRSYPDVDDGGVHLTEEQKVAISSLVKRKFQSQGIHDYVEDVLKVVEIEPKNFAFLSSRDAADGDILFRYRMSVRVVFDNLAQERYVANLLVGGKGRYFQRADGAGHDATFERTLHDKKVSRVKAYSGAP